MPDYSRVYARQEYMTPGAARTVEIIAEETQPTERSLLIDVACGKGEASATLAGRFACRIAALDLYDPFIHHTAAKAWFFNLRDLITVLRANGTLLPFRDDSFDCGFCIGAPSIVGLDASLSQLARVIRRNGTVVVSDVVWRTKPQTPLTDEWKWLAHSEPKLSAAEYADAIARAGLTVTRTEIHPRSDWEEYFAPMLQVAREAMTNQPADIAFADDIESSVALERRASEEYIDYATFVARKP